MRTSPRPTRRALLAGAGALALTTSLTACDLPTPTRERAADTEDPAQGDEDPDLRHVTAANHRTDELLALLTATTVAHPSLESRLAPLSACHRAHLAVLQDALPDNRSDAGAPTPPTPPTDEPTATPGSLSAPPSAPEVPSRPPGALRNVTTLELEHAAALVTMAGAAESGALARLLGVMGAGVHMHLEALDNQIEGGA